MTVVKLIDEMMLRSIIEQAHSLSFECDNCCRLVAMDLLDLIGRLGANATVGDVRRKLVCRRCNKRRARALIKPAIEKTNGSDTATGWPIVELISRVAAASIAAAERKWAASNQSNGRIKY